MKPADNSEPIQKVARHLSWLLSGLAGLLLGAFITFVPFYLHALEDWELADKTTFFPRELGDIASFYSHIWSAGGIAGAVLGLVALGTIRHFNSKQAVNQKALKAGGH